MLLNTLQQLNNSLPLTEKMPVLFVGHGNPMNALAVNDYTRTWNELGKTLPRPAAVLCISAHWQTRGTFVTPVERPETIHDFYGFPRALFEVQYPAPGSPMAAHETKETVTHTPVHYDYEWGLDHGSWSVLKHIYPQADIPVLELSMDIDRHAGWHFELAQQLAALRNKGVLLVGSGNIVHNLRLVDFNKPGGFDWALEANNLFKKLVDERDYQSLVNFSSLGNAAKLAIPTSEHFLPLLYTLGATGKNEPISVFNDRAEAGSLTMTSFKIG